MSNFLPTNLVFLRKRYKVSQTQLALQVKKGQTTIGNWENDVTQPSVEDLLELKQFFIISLDDLLETDLRKIEETRLKEIVKKEGEVKGNSKVNSQNFSDSDTDFAVREPDATSLWAIMHILRQQDQKLDQLLDLAQNKTLKDAK